MARRRLTTRTITDPLLPPRIAVRTLSAASPPPVHVRRIFDKPGYRGTDFISVALRIEAAGQHDVSVREKLPEGWTAAEIAGGGFLDPGNGRIDWDLAGVSGTQEVSYRLEPLGPCPGSGAFCGNGSEASQYTIDQVTARSRRRLPVRQGLERER